MQRRHRRAHTLIWLALGLLLPALLLGAWALRQPPEAGGPPVRISAP